MRLPLFLYLLALCLPRPCSGQAREAPRPTVQLRADALACGDSEAIADQIRLRSRYDVARQRDVGGMVAHVEIRRGQLGHGYLAAIRLAQDGQVLLRRELNAETCSELLAGIGFVVALALDPPDAQALNEPAQPHPGAAGVDQDESRSAARWWNTSTALGAGASVLFGLAPRAAIGGTLVVDVRAKSGSGWSDAASLRIDLGYVTSRTIRARGGEANLALASATLHLCPLALPVWNRASLRPCLMASGGAVLAEGRKTLDAKARRRPWLLVGLSAAGEIVAGDSWAAGALVSVGAPLIRDHFQFEPAVFHQVPAIAGLASLTLTRRF